jgi:CRP/FNR family cyclic AMP-dependent transcriptional regulator
MAEERATSGADAALTLAGVRILKSLPDEERRRLETSCVYRRVAAGQTLMSRFEIGKAVMFMLVGRARVAHFLANDEEVTIAVVPTGETLGEISAIDGGTASATIIAEDDCIVAELSTTEFQALLARRGEVALSLLRRWAGIIRDLDDKVSVISVVAPDQRIYSELVRLARVESPGSDRWIIPELPSHQDLAVRSQTSREAVAGAIAELASRGIVERRTRALHIRDYRALRDMTRHGTPAPDAKAGAG